MSVELKPCPFCGGEAQLWPATKNSVLTRDAWVACMGDCDVLMTRDFQTTEAAVAAWNRRAPPGDDR